MAMNSCKVRVLALVLAGGGGGGKGRGAWAARRERGRGKAARISMVTSYEACTNPNTSTEGGLPTPSCSPPVRSDPVCGFGSLFGMVGMAKGKAQVHDGDIQLSVTASGLGTGCEGHNLCGVVRVRVTTHRCPLSPCTTTDLELTNLSDTGLLHRHKRQLQAEDEHQHR